MDLPKDDHGWPKQAYDRLHGDQPDLGTATKEELTAGFSMMPRSSDLLLVICLGATIEHLRYVSPPSIDRTVLRHRPSAPVITLCVSHSIFFFPLITLISCAITPLRQLSQAMRCGRRFATREFRFYKSHRPGSAAIRIGRSGALMPGPGGGHWQCRAARPRPQQSWNA